MSSGYLLHIGYHKTGTTWLQKHYFPRRQAGFAFMREQEGFVEQGLEGKTPGRFIIEQPLFHYDPARVRALLDEHFAADTAQGLMPVISHEELSGNAISGGWRAKEFAWRLASSFPEARVLIVVREQRTMIRASYMQYIRAGGGMTLADFMHPGPDPNVPQPDLYYFRYDGLLALYRELFPQDRVLCLPFELFRDRPQEFLARLDAFAGAPPDATLPTDQRENPGTDMLRYKALRWFNPLIKRNSANGRSPYASDFLKRCLYKTLRITRHLPARWERRYVEGWDSEIERTTLGFYEESNRHLGQMIGYDLGQFGWRV